jgi:hypothetical protein
MLTIPDKVSNSKSGERILLVDDEPDVTMLFSMVLNTSNGFDVYSFNDPCWDAIIRNTSNTALCQYSHRTRS